MGLDANNSDNFHDGNPYQYEQCGGVIIDEKNILTAGHCQRAKTTFFKYHSIIVYAGEHNINKWGDGESKYEVCGWTIYPKYLDVKTPSLRGPDIAILHLCEPLTFRKGKFDILLMYS